MESWAGIIGTVIAIAAFIGSFDPRLTPDGRRQSRIGRDLELLGSMPKGRAAKRLRAQVSAATMKMLDERERDKRMEQLPLVLLAALSAGVAAASFVPMVPTSTLWGTSLAGGLIAVVFICATLALCLILGALFVLVRRAVEVVGRGWRWVRARRTLVDESAEDVGDAEVVMG